MDADLPALEARARKYLYWAVFMLAMMACILVIDLQLKKQVAKLAVEAAELLSKAVAYGGQAPDTPANPGAGSDRDRGVGSDARLATPASDSEGEAPQPDAAGMDGVADRAPGNGRRTGRPRGSG